MSELSTALSAFKEIAANEVFKRLSADYTLQSRFNLQTQPLELVAGNSLLI